MIHRRQMEKPRQFRTTKSAGYVPGSIHQASGGSYHLDNSPHPPPPTHGGFPLNSETLRFLENNRSRINGLRRKAMQRNATHRVAMWEFQPVCPVVFGVAGPDCQNMIDIHLRLIRPDSALYPRTVYVPLLWKRRPKILAQIRPGPDYFHQGINSRKSLMFKGGRRGGDRTHNPRLRRPVLYPIELLAPVHIILASNDLRIHEQTPQVRPGGFGLHQPETHRRR
jgi:hypothetical protein